jgi:hypothetical protein
MPQLRSPVVPTSVRTNEHNLRFGMLPKIQGVNIQSKEGLHVSWGFSYKCN